jgi:hypothetical protein
MVFFDPIDDGSDRLVTEHREGDTARQFGYGPVFAHL